jgi:hypothetical protein
MIEIKNKKAVELKLIELVSDLRKKRFQKTDKHSGISFLITAAFYYLGARKAGYYPKTSKTHWWLENDKGEILDLATLEVENLEKHYQKGEWGSFDYTPSERVQTLMERIKSMCKHG